MLLGNQVDYIITSNHFIWKSTCIYSVCVYIYIYTNIRNREVRESKERGGGGWMKKERRKDGRGRRKEESVINVDYLHELFNGITMKMLLFTTKKEIFTWK